MRPLAIQLRRLLDHMHDVPAHPVLLFFRESGMVPLWALPHSLQSAELQPALDQRRGLLCLRLFWHSTNCTVGRFASLQSPNRSAPGMSQRGGRPAR